MPIIGAFAAGLVLSTTNQFDAVVERIEPVADVFTPIFFVAVGAPAEHPAGRVQAHRFLQHPAALLEPAESGRIETLGRRARSELAMQLLD